MMAQTVDTGGSVGVIGEGDSFIKKPSPISVQPPPPPPLQEPTTRTTDTDSPLDINNVTVNQVFEDPSEKIVDFSPVPLWQIGEENVIEYTLPHGYEEAGNDWIGIYKVKYNIWVVLLW